MTNPYNIKVNIIPIEDALKLKSVEEITKQINDRLQLQNIMVGQLYPSILESEMEKLCELRWNLQYSK